MGNPTKPPLSLGIFTAPEGTEAAAPEVSLDSVMKNLAFLQHPKGQGQVCSLSPS